MRRTAAAQGVRMLKFMDVFGRWEATELSQLERRSCWGWASGHSAAGAGVMRKRMTLPAGPPDRQGVGQARSGGPERGGGGVVSDAVFGLHGAALPRASGARSSVCLELQLDQGIPAKPPSAGEGTPSRRASAPAAASSVAGMMPSAHLRRAGSNAIALGGAAPCCSL